MPPLNGSGVASGLSDNIAFAKMIELGGRGSFYNFQLLDALDVTWNDHGIQLDSVAPATATEEDREVLGLMVNLLVILPVKTVRSQLEEKIEPIFFYYLQNSLYDEHHPISIEFDYVWSSALPKGRLLFLLTGE